MVARNSVLISEVVINILLFRLMSLIVIFVRASQMLASRSKRQLPYLFTVEIWLLSTMYLFVILDLNKVTDLIRFTDWLLEMSFLIRVDEKRDSVTCSLLRSRSLSRHATQRGEERCVTRQRTAA